MAPRAHSIGQQEAGRVHAYLFEHGDELTLVDTMWDSDARVVLDYLAHMGRRPTDLRHIVITHAHRSHLGGLAALKLISGATVHAHPWEGPIIDGGRPAQRVGLRPLRPLGIYQYRLGLLLGLHPHRPCTVDEPLEGGETVGPLEVIHAPGHTPGHLAFYCRELRFLVAGDAVATWPALGPGWPGFNLDEGRHRESLRVLAGHDRVETLAVGHGAPLSRGAQEQLDQLAEIT